ncbi:MAG: PASTA domain-containing protein [Clostridiales bacterium]|nr:PASTA domain-containing protein [Clostridiales bacterium]
MKTNKYTLLSIQKRLLALILSVTFIFCILGGRLIYIQLVQGRDLQTRAGDQWTRDLPTTAKRGDILDTNGKILAESYSSYSVFVRPRAVTDKNKVADVLSAVLGLSSEEVLSALNKSVSEVKLARQADKAAVDAIRLNKLDGVYYSEDISRRYAEGEFLTQVMGFINVDGVGQSGLEAYYNKYLQGINGSVLTETDAGGIEIPQSTGKYIPSIPGYNVTLTIDAEIQRFAERAVKDAQAQYGSLSASAVVMEVNTGAIAAMASYPSYDLNNPPRDNMALLNSLTKNKMIVDVYEPGSTFKVFTTSAALEEGKTSLADRFFDPGYRIVDGQRIKCWRTHGHGSQTLQEGVNNSCNSVFMDLALRLGTEKFYNYLQAFGFGEQTGVDFAGESRGILMPERSVKNVDLARIGFGQAVACTPLQLITGLSAVVNGGKLMKPYFVREIASADGQTALIVNPTTVRRVISEKTSAVMREILEGVVKTGSGKLSQVAGYRIGGKTGTAQKYSDGVINRGKYVSSFISFAPADDPQYAVLVIVDEPSGYVYYGSIVCGPYSKYIFERILTYKKIKPDNIAEDIASLAPTLEMPDIMGLTYSQAAALINGMGLQYELAGESGTVINQIPAAGVMLPKGYVVLIRLETE